MTPILVATDLTPRGDLAVARAAAIARDRDAPLHLLHVVEDDRPNADVLLSEAEAEVSLVDQLDALSLPHVTASVETGHAAIMVPRIARQMAAQLVVFGTHRHRGLADWVGRPNLLRLLGSLPCPALVAVLPASRSYLDVLVGWDFTEASEEVAQRAADLFPEAEQILGHAVSPANLVGMTPGTAMAELCLEQADVSVKALASAAKARRARPLWQVGAPASVLREMARENEIDVLAVGRHSKGPLTRLVLGETALALALDAPCDVLITPPAA